MLPAVKPLSSKRTSNVKATKTHPAEAHRELSQPSDDEIWDDIFASPESEAFLTLMIAQVRQEEAKGKLIEGGWDEI